MERTHFTEGTLVVQAHTDDGEVWEDSISIADLLRRTGAMHDGRTVNELRIHIACPKACGARISPASSSDYGVFGDRIIGGAYFNHAPWDGQNECPLNEHHS